MHVYKKDQLKVMINKGDCSTANLQNQTIVQKN